MTVAGIVLAAGRGSRFRGAPHHSDKMKAPFRGKPMVLWAIEAAVEAGLPKVFVVTGATDLRGIVPSAGNVELVANGRWADGLATSLHAGIAAADGDDHDAVVVGLGDQPLVPSSAWRAVADAEGSGPEVVVATYGGMRRNPVLLRRSVWPLLPRVGDEGARVLFRERPELVGEVACEGEPADVDTVEDLTRWS